MTNEIIRDCKNCKYYVSLNTGMTSKPIQACKKWECEFKAKAEAEKRTIKITVTFEEIERLSKEELATLILLRLTKILEKE